MKLKNWSWGVATLAAGAMVALVWSPAEVTPTKAITITWGVPLASDAGQATSFARMVAGGNNGSVKLDSNCGAGGALTANTTGGKARQVIAMVRGNNGVGTVTGFSLTNGTTSAGTGSRPGVIENEGGFLELPRSCGPAKRIREADRNLAADSHLRWCWRGDRYG